MSREEWRKFCKWADSETYGSEYYGLRKLREDTPDKIKKEYKQYLEKELNK